MALWKRSAKPTSTEAGPEALPAADPSGLDAGELLDTIASLLRTEGELAIPIANEDRGCGARRLRIVGAAHARRLTATGRPGR